MTVFSSALRSACGKPGSVDLGKALAVVRQPADAHDIVGIDGFGKRHRCRQQFGQRRIRGDALEHVALAGHDALRVDALGDVGDAGAHQPLRSWQRHEAHFGYYALPVRSPIVPFKSAAGRHPLGAGGGEQARRLRALRLAAAQAI